ncbi:hypothetical protein HYW75_04060 [Candidatus Pacearchaeota archaeon]|nr:hypothetical protein [Candidatus Pacearchaeota archaeon]
MKRFTKLEIDKWRSIFIERGYPQRNANLDGRVIAYFVMPMNIFQGIPNGLFRMTGDIKEGYIIGVSQQVPLEIQPHFAVSEHDEFMVYGLNDQQRTLHSEQNILRILGGSNLRKIYIPNKVRLYDHIITNAKDDLEKWGFTEKDYKGFILARYYLNLVVTKS